MIRVRPAVDTDADAWQVMLGATASGDFLHDWAWASVAAFDGQPQRRFVAEDDGQLVALVAAQVRGLPLGRSFWYVPHGPVLDYDAPGAGERLRAVVIGLREAARRGGAIAVKLEPRVTAASPHAALFGRLHLRPEPATIQVGQTRLVALADDDDLLAGFDKDTRYAVRRAGREGVTVRTFTDATDAAPIDRLHDLVTETQARAGFPLPPRETVPVAPASSRRATAIACSPRRCSSSRACGRSISSPDRCARGRASRSATRATPSNGP